MPSPVVGGTVGRTDQGVDISATPGARIIDPVPGISRMVGTLQNWYQGQPFSWFQVLSGPFRGRYWYGAEQARFSTSPGQTVRQGQQIGSYAPSGTGTEFGWATKSGATLAYSQTGQGGGSPTQAGAEFMSQIVRPRGNGVGGASAATTTARGNLEQLWVDAGGPQSVAKTAAAIAMAESAGQVGAVNHNSNGSTDRGLWQINSVHSQYDANRLLTDPLYNAQAAVAVYKAAGNSFTPWATYNSGAYLAFLGVKTPSYSLSGGGYGGSRPGGGSSSSSGSGGLSGIADAISFVLDPTTLLRAVEFLAGMGIMATGLSVIMRSVTGQGPISRAAESAPGRLVVDATGATVAGRALQARKFERQGRRHARQDETNRRNQEAYRRGRSSSANQRQRRRASRETDEIPF